MKYNQQGQRVYELWIGEDLIYEGPLMCGPPLEGETLYVPNRGTVVILGWKGTSGFRCEPLGGHWRET